MWSRRLKIETSQIETSRSLRAFKFPTKRLLAHYQALVKATSVKIGFCASFLAL